MKLEEKIVEEIYERIKNRLLGKTNEYDRILDNNPDSIIFVGKLQSKETSEKYTQYKTIISPNSIGMVFNLVVKNPDPTIDVIVNFSIYYRVYPSFEEQKNATIREDIRKVWKKETIKTTFSCKVKEGSYNFKEELKNKIKEAIEGKSGKPYYETVYRAKGNANFIPEKHLKSEEDFIKYLKSRNGKIYDIPYNIDLKVDITECNNHEFNINITLVNNTSSKSHVFCTTLFDPEIKIELKDNKLERQKLEFMHDDEGKIFDIPGKGINCSVEYDEESNIIKTTVIPTYKQKRLKPRSSVGKWTPYFKDLSTDPLPILDGIYSEMENYLNTLSKEKVADNELVKVMMEQFEDEIKRFRKGIEFLRRDEKALMAFKLMNRVMFEATRSSDGRWYIFQIIFIVSNLDCCLSQEVDKVEVLHVPTGGGKTWSYLGLVIFSIFYERLNKKDFGVTAWIKFPLRMLSLQQLEIITTFISYANKIKEETESIRDSDPISVGYLVGGKNTPNTYKQAKEWKEDFKVVTDCPFCKGKIEIEFDDDKERVYHKCTKCGKILPVMVIDYEIYRYLPSVIVSTLDKAAVLNYNYRAKSLFGGPIIKCEKNYGYLPYGPNWCLKSRSNQNFSGCKYYKNGKCTKNKINGKPPILLIQDELHMVREFDGCLDSYLEGIIEEVIKGYGGAGLKVIAPSATAAGVERQVKHLYYKKEARKFPLFKEFYFEEKEEIHRISVGILPVGRAINWATWHIIKEIEKTLQQMTKEAKDLKDKDRYQVLEKYYNIILAYHRSKRDANELQSGLMGIINEELRREGFEPINISKTEIITGEKSLGELRKLMERIVTNDRSKRIKLIGSTLIISHGIDFDELNLMVFRSMPKSVSEYEQARSRVGRKFPSLIFIIYHGNLARDQSFYKYFIPFHGNVNKYVENIPLNRWASKSVDLMAPSAILSVIHSYFIDNKNLNMSFMECRELVRAIKSKKLTKNEIIEKASEYLYLNSAPRAYQEKFKEDVEHWLQLLLDSCHSKSPRNQLAEIYKKEDRPVYSLRTIEKEVSFYPTPETHSIEPEITKSVNVEPSPEYRYTSTDEELEGIYVDTEEEVNA